MKGRRLYLELRQIAPDEVTADLEAVRGAAFVGPALSDRARAAAWRLRAFENRECAS